MKIYEYPKCSTCKKALKFLDDHGVTYVKVDIKQVPPKKTELRKMLKYMDGEIKKLFNTSGEMYRELKLKDRLALMNTEEAIDLLAENGMLVKRPFVLLEDGGLVGFREERWSETLGLK
ncbi:MAG: arsenate reductase family protein [bacterium]|nr:arsenate reductase family protein [bacterium]